MLKQEFLDYYRGLSECCGVPVEVLDQVIDVIAFVESEHDEGSGAALATCASGFLTFSEWQDYTGHGCRCGASYDGPFPTLREAYWKGLDENERDLLGATIREAGLDPGPEEEE